ncbi:DUF6093 family protein [Microbacterium sp. M]|uniref:DUF6093 family protein n=1 Tax=Microbacterium sp. M TaxID=3377125 RepID=UPI003862E29A
MALSPISDDADWPLEILESAREEFNGTLIVSKAGEPGEFDPITGGTTGGTPPTVVLGPRAARAQNLAMPSEINGGDSWETKRRYRFQCEILPGDPSITKGLIVTFDGGRDPEIEKMTFQVLWATNSSHAALRTIYCATEGARVPA